MSKFVFGARYGARLITQTTPPLPSFKTLLFELLVDRVIDIFFGNVKTDQEKGNFSKSFGIKGEEPF
jgi:hypothetical protein